MRKPQILDMAKQKSYSLALTSLGGCRALPRREGGGVCAERKQLGLLSAPFCTHTPLYLPCWQEVEKQLPYPPLTPNPELRRPSPVPWDWFGVEITSCPHPLP